MAPGQAGISSFDALGQYGWILSLMFLVGAFIESWHLGSGRRSGDADGSCFASRLASSYPSKAVPSIVGEVRYADTSDRARAEQELFD